MTKTKDAEIQRQLTIFQRNFRNKARNDRNIARRANADYFATERDAKRAKRVNANYLATERDAIRTRQANADDAATERNANTKTRRAKRPQRAKFLDEGNVELSSREISFKIRS
jgi:hypothetical protein